jgi:hypothetical protein
MPKFGSRVNLRNLWLYNRKSSNLFTRIIKNFVYLFLINIKIIYYNQINKKPKKNQKTKNKNKNKIKKQKNKNKKTKKKINFLSLLIKNTKNI